MVLGARGWWPFAEGTPTETVFRGHTDKGEDFVLLLRDDRFHSFSTHIAARCPGERDSHSWAWYPNEHVWGVTFRHQGRSLYAREAPGGLWRGETVLRGELADDGSSVSGTMSVTAVPRANDAALPCTGTAIFTARRVRR
jgi:hypothetical protein